MKYFWKRLKQKIKKYDIISFDIYDTLIIRNVSRSIDVFLLMECYLCRKEGERYQGFSQRRMIAEKRARHDAAREEIVLRDIYNQLNIETEAEKEKLEQIECQIELEVAAANEKMKEIFQLCMKEKKCIWICSDMYLDRQLIERILEKCGIQGYSRLFLSSEMQKTKRNGTVFSIYKAETARILHIGDNRKSDYWMPKKYGVHTVWYKRKKKGRQQNISSMYLAQTLKNINDNQGYWKRVGGEILSPFLYGYILWLQKKLSEKKYDKIFFLSRDGYIVQRAMEAVNMKDILEKGEYLYISRRSVIVPALWKHVSYGDMCKTMFWKRHFKIRDFVTNFGLIYEEYREAVSRIIKNEDQEFYRNTMMSDVSLIQVYSLLEADIRNNSKSEYRMLVRYLQQMGVHGRIALVDSGWHGNIQNAIQELCDEAGIPVEIDGYYIGVRSDSKVLEKQNMEGYLFQGKMNDRWENEERKINAIVEACFSSEEASVWKYMEEGKVIRPVFQKEDRRIEQIEYLRILQRHALECVKHLSGLKYMEMDHMTPDQCFFGLYRLGISPTLEDARKIGAFVEKEVPDNLGLCWSGIRNCRRKLLEADWKIGFLKRLLILNLKYGLLQEQLEKLGR